MNRSILQRSLSILVVVMLAVAGCGHEDAAPPALPMDAESVARGRLISEGLGSCGFCHSLDGKPGSKLAGGRSMQDVYGDVRGPNITLAESGIGTWSETNVRAFFRSNVRPDGSQVYSTFHEGLEWMADVDLTAIVAYLRSIPSVEHEVEHREISFFARNTTGFFLSPSEVKGYVPRISTNFKTEYGEYLVNNIAGCDRCHSSPGGIIESSDHLAGGKDISFDGKSKVAPNITTSKESGIGTWSTEDLIRYLRSGKTPAGRDVDKDFCPVEFYQRASDADVEAVAAYLKSVPPIDSK